MSGSAFVPLQSSRSAGCRRPGFALSGTEDFEKRSLARAPGSQRRVILASLAAELPSAPHREDSRNLRRKTLLVHPTKDCISEAHRKWGLYVLTEEVGVLTAITESILPSMSR